MNEETNTPEPLSAILAEMREFCSGWSEDVDVTVKVGLIYGWMCRIKEAAEREREAAQSAPGNAAALREALERIRPLVRAAGVTPYVPECKELVDGALGIIDASLAAPARNCDRFATAEEAVAAFADHLRAWENAHGVCSEYPDHPVQVPAGAFAWLFAPAEGGVK